MEEPKFEKYPQRNTERVGREGNGPGVDSTRPKTIPYTLSIEANRQSREEQISKFCPKAHIDEAKAVEESGNTKDEFKTEEYTK